MEASNPPFCPSRSVAETFVDLNARRVAQGKPTVWPASLVDDLPGTSARIKSAEVRRWRRFCKPYDVSVAAPRRATCGGGGWRQWTICALTRISGTAAAMTCRTATGDGR